MSVIVPAIFFFNTVAGDAALARVDPARPSTLSPSSRCDDISGTVPLHLAITEMLLESELCSILKDHPKDKLITPEDIVKALDGREARQATKFSPIKVQFFLNKTNYVAPGPSGRLHVLCRLIDDSYPEPFTYHAFFSPSMDPANAISIDVYTKDEFAQGAVTKRDENDAKERERYIRHDRIIDEWIDAKMRDVKNYYEFRTGSLEMKLLEHQLMTGSYRLKELQAALERAAGVDWLSELIQRRRTVLIKASEDELPVIEEDGKRIRVRSHTSANGRYIFMNEKDAEVIHSLCSSITGNSFKKLDALYVAAKRILHEVGVELNMPYKISEPVLKTPGAAAALETVNDLDLAYAACITASRSSWMYKQLPDYRGALRAVRDHFNDGKLKWRNVYGAVSYKDTLGTVIHGRDYMSGSAKSEPDPKIALAGMIEQLSTLARNILTIMSIATDTQGASTHEPVAAVAMMKEEFTAGDIYHYWRYWRKAFGFDAIYTETPQGYSDRRFFAALSDLKRVGLIISAGDINDTSSKLRPTNKLRELLTLFPVTVDGQIVAEEKGFLRATEGRVSYPYGISSSRSDRDVIEVSIAEAAAITRTIANYVRTLKISQADEPVFRNNAEAAFAIASAALADIDRQAEVDKSGFGENIVNAIDSLLRDLRGLGASFGTNKAVTLRRLVETELPKYIRRPLGGGGRSALGKSPEDAVKIIARAGLFEPFTLKQYIEAYEIYAEEFGFEPNISKSTARRDLYISLWSLEKQGIIEIINREEVVSKRERAYKFKVVEERLSEAIRYPAKSPMDIAIERKIGQLTMLAGNTTWKKIPTDEESRYTLLVTSKFFANGEKARDIAEYKGRFFIETFNAVEGIAEKIKGRKDRTIVLIENNTPPKQLAMLKQNGIRFMLIDPKEILKGKREHYGGPEELARRDQFRLDTYVTMLLARRIDDSLSSDSSIYRTLEFFIRSHFKLDGINSRAYIDAIKKGDVNELLRGYLMYRPAKRYDLPTYKNIAAALISA